MKEEEGKILGAMPCNDRALFLEEDGFIRERIGIVWKAGALLDMKALVLLIGTVLFTNLYL